MTQRSAETPLRVLRKSCADTSSSSAPRCRESDAFMKSGLLRSKCVTSSNPAFTTTAIIIIIKIYHYNSLLNFHAELHEGLGTKKKYDATLMSLWHVRAALLLITQARVSNPGPVLNQFINHLLSAAFSLTFMSHYLFFKYVINL